jgi:hypothetical protein
LEDAGEGQSEETLRHASEDVHMQGISRDGDSGTLSMYYRWNKNLKQMLETARSCVKECVERVREEVKTLRKLLGNGARARKLLSSSNNQTSQNETAVHKMRSIQHAGNQTQAQEEKYTGKEEAHRVANMRVNASDHVRGMSTHLTISTL